MPPPDETLKKISMSIKNLDKTFQKLQSELKSLQALTEKSLKQKPSKKPKDNGWNSR